ncbi:MAG: Fic/DOC family N-terminal domain-containing protein [Planctomycetota bacterium]
MTGTYRTTRVGAETIRAFIPHPLPPKAPPLVIEGHLAGLHAQALTALERLAGAMVPSAEWFLYGFVRKEAVISSQIEGTQATLMDVLTYEATDRSPHPADVMEICNYVDALAYARAQLAGPRSLPLCTRLVPVNK